METLNGKNQRTANIPRGQQTSKHQQKSFAAWLLFRWILWLAIYPFMDMVCHPVQEPCHSILLKLSFSLSGLAV